jgi:hypothetical protein
VSANAGDHLHFATSTPSGGPNEFANNLYPELLLYDPNGNLVAIANGNAADGRNSVIDFTVPQGDAGSWIVEVTPSPSTATPTAGEYGLLVTGATGALAPFTVTAANPAPGALVQPPQTITITFNQPVLLISLTPGELAVNGVAATAVTDVNGKTVSWTIPVSAFGTGVDLTNVVTLGADAGGNQVMDVAGQTLVPFSYTFFTTNVAPYIVSSSVDIRSRPLSTRRSRTARATTRSGRPSTSPAARTRSAGAWPTGWRSSAASSAAPPSAIAWWSRRATPTSP